MLDELRAAAERHGVHLHVVRRDQLTAFASAVAYAGDIEHPTPRLTRRRGGVDHPGRARSTTGSRAQHGARRHGAPIPPRDLNPAARAGDGPGRRRGPRHRVHILALDNDEPRGWLAAGEALSDVWLTLTARGLAASPISEVIEVPAVRQALRRLLGGVGHPAIAMRIGTPVDARPVPATTRRPGTDTIGLPGQC